MTNWFELGVMKYWAPTSAMSPEVRQQHLEDMAASGKYLWSEKFDGNFSRAVITPDRNALQTRGISKVTGTYSELQDKVFFWDNVLNAFQNTTVILGEIYLPGGIDKDVGSITRCLVDKARARQKDVKLEWRIFDVLALDGEEFLDKPIEYRVQFIPDVVKRINSPLVKGITYHQMDETFFDEILKIFERGGEGAVCYKKGILYTPDKRSSAWTTCKVKQEISSDIDCFITDVEKPTKLYTGKELTSWPFWEEARTSKLVYGEYFGEYRTGGAYTPVTKNYYYNYPGAIYVSVFNRKGDPIQLCKVAGLTDELKAELRDNFENWYMCPLTIGGMMVSTANAAKDGTGISIRHPYIKRIRKDDLNPEDCTLEKIIS